MKDTLLHIVLGAVFGVAVLTLCLSLSVGLAIAATGSLFIYLREVTQRQTGKGMGFENGWLPWRWLSNDGSLNAQKVVETFVPVLMLFVAGAAWDWFL